jgi:hypothetical protein
LSFLDQLKSLAGLAGEYRRALAAARRYDELKSGRASIARRQDISRQVFEEFYAPIDGKSGLRQASPFAAVHCGKAVLAWRIWSSSTGTYWTKGQ